MATRKYLCDWRMNPADESMFVPSIAAAIPHLDYSAEVASQQNPMIPTGRVVVTVLNVNTLMHGEIMQVPGVELFDDNIV